MEFLPFLALGLIILCGVGLFPLLMIGGIIYLYRAYDKRIKTMVWVTWQAVKGKRVHPQARFRLDRLFWPGQPASAIPHHPSD
jgi:hypothetical protein